MTDQNSALQPVAETPSGCPNCLPWEFCLACKATQQETNRRAVAETPPPADQDEPLHTGDDERLDHMTAIRTAVDEAIDECDSFGDIDLAEKLRGVIEDCDKLDSLIIATIKAERLAALQAGPAPPKEPVYYAEALDLAADMLRRLKPEELQERAPKIIAILTNAAHALRKAGPAPPALREQLAKLLVFDGYTPEGFSYWPCANCGKLESAHAVKTSACPPNLLNKKLRALLDAAGEQK